jgi:serine/threonine-protein kinase
VGESGEHTVIDRDEAATVVAGPPRSLAPGGTGTLGSRFQTAEATLILQREEILRSRALLRLILALVVVSSSAVWVTKKDVYRMLLAPVFIVLFLFTVVLILRFRKPERFDSRLMLAYGLVCVAAVLAGSLHLGVFSLAMMAGCLGVYFYGLSDHALSGWAIYLSLSAGYFVLFSLAVVGVFPLEHAVLPVMNPDRPALFALGLGAEVLLGLTFLLARRSRRATREAFERLERAALQIRQKDALLNEARAEFDLARAGKVGRYTDKLVGGYQVGEIIGRGAMGEVYAARDATNGQEVALKFLSASMFGEPDFLERFFREAKVASQLRSRHVIRSFGRGQAEDGAPFIAMELLRGVDLAERLRNEKRFPLDEVVDLVEQIASALSEAGSVGVVHRDIKPQNLFWSEPDGVWKILDFGISKVREATAQLTQGAAIGTPSYMSPEQARGIEVDHRSDVFSLGVVAYRSLTGRPAFTALDSPVTIYNVVHMQPLQPSDAGLTFSPAVEQVLALALAKDRERRFQTASAFAHALASAAKNQLDARVARDAQRLLAEHPWGSELGRRG